MYSLRSGSAIGTKDSSAHTATDKCLILQYHRVAALCHDPLQLAVRPHNFERQIEYLAENFNVISMDSLKQHLDTTTPFPKRTVVVTFDGGYADLLYTGKEVLEKYGTFAAAFAPSAQITEAKQFWLTELEDLLIAGNAKGHLEIEIDGKCYMWSLRSRRDAFQTFDILCPIMQSGPPSAQKRILSQIKLGVNVTDAEPDCHRVMDAQELRLLQEGGLITVGGHTHNLVKLSALPRWQQIEQLGRNKEILEEALEHPVEYFSYPFGNAEEHIKEAAAVLPDVGFALACANSYGTVSGAQPADRYELPRVKVGDWNPFTFYKFLEGFFT